MSNTGAPALLGRQPLRECVFGRLTAAGAFRPFWVSPLPGPALQACCGRFHTLLLVRPGAD
jgi:hypothetical protein